MCQPLERRGFEAGGAQQSHAVCNESIAALTRRHNAEYRSIGAFRESRIMAGGFPECFGGFRRVEDVVGDLERQPERRAGGAERRNRRSVATGSDRSPRETGLDERAGLGAVSRLEIG